MTATPIAAPVQARADRPAGGRSAGAGRWWLNWLGPVLVTLIGGWLRFADLGRPNAVVFDETYYAKDALSLLRFGYEQGAVDGANEILLDSNGDPYALEIFNGEPSFVVHPPVGKWVIAAGEWAFGATPFGWRFGVAVLGTLSVLLLARAVWKLTGSPLWGTVAGLLLAIDGMGIVMSRTAVLDGVLAFFVLAAFLALLADRDWIRKQKPTFTGWSLWRPWRLVAGVMLGLACGVKWSGVWFLAAFAVMTVLWEVGRRRRLGERPIVALVRDGFPTAVTVVVVALVVYVLSWWGWFTNPGGWARDWADGDGVMAALSSLWHYHAEILSFHTGLSSEHSYQSPAWGWLIQARPTSFFFESSATSCPSGNCAQEVIALGNPLIWWAAILALLHQTWRWFARRDWRAGAVVLGVLAGWAPWLLYTDRTIFAFYSVAFLPFMVAALTLSLASIASKSRGDRAAQAFGAGSPSPASIPAAESGFVTVTTEEPDGPRGQERPASTTSGRARIVLVAAFLLACVALSWWFYPIWSAQIIDYSAWSDRMWLNTWV